MLSCVAFVIAAARADASTVEISPNVYMPLLNLGNYNFSTNVSLWLELGGRGVDTAYSYGDDVQRDAGAAIAAAIAAGTVTREQVFVTTKVPCCPDDFSTSGACAHHSGHFPAEDAAKDLELLGLEYADLILMHWPCQTMEETLASYASLESVVADGKARAIGVSNFNATVLAGVLAMATVKPAINQCAFSVGNHKPTETATGEDDVTRAACAAAGVTYSAYSPLGGLSDVDVLHDPAVLAIAASHNRTAAQVALRWVVQQQVVAVSASTEEKYDVGDLEIFDFELTADEMATLTAIQPNSVN